MSMAKTQAQQKLTGITKVPTGIQGLDEILNGGLPCGRSSLVCGNAGCGKTFLGMQFLVNGAQKYGSPGVFVSFEETSEELRKNFASIGVDLNDLEKRKLLALDYIFIERSEIKETGEFDLEGLFVRLGQAVRSIGAKRIVIDTIEALFSGFSNEAILRAELRRLFRWLKSNGLTAIITGERIGEIFTRHGLEEFVADCVILLDNNIVDQISTRRMRIVKYRGSSHGTNEYPFLIGANGMSVLPITSISMDYKVTAERISSGIEALDRMLEGEGYFRGSSILVSGSPGSGKTSIASHFLDACCRRGEKCLLFTFEESGEQLARNLESIGLHLKIGVKKGLLKIIAQRPTFQGLEFHLLEIHDLVRRFGPQAVVVDPVSCFSCVGKNWQIRSMLSRLVDFFKSENITALFTDLINGNDPAEESYISSLADTWILLNNASGMQRERSLGIIKSRGMAHSDEFFPIKIGREGLGLGKARHEGLKKGVVSIETFGAGR